MLWIFMANEKLTRLSAFPPPPRPNRTIELWLFRSVFFLLSLCRTHRFDIASAIGTVSMWIPFILSMLWHQKTKIKQNKTRRKKKMHIEYFPKPIASSLLTFSHLLKTGFFFFFSILFSCHFIWQTCDEDVDQIFFCIRIDKARQVSVWRAKE